MRLNWISIRQLATAVMATALLGLAAGATGASGATPTHVFDATLSLTGGCTTSPIDPVADPGCPDPALHPPKSFTTPTGVAVDLYGNIYVANCDPAVGDGSEGRIDIFRPDGSFITELLDPFGPISIAVDSKGVLYVNNRNGDNGEAGQGLVRYEPTTYDGGDGEIEYGPPIVIVEYASFTPLAVNFDNDHLFAHFGLQGVAEFASAEDDNELIDPDAADVSQNGIGEGLALDAAHNRIYATDYWNSGSKTTIRIFELAAPHNPLGTIAASATPLGKFVGPLGLAVDEGTGHVFVFDKEGAKVYEFTATGEYVSTIEHSFQTYFSGIAVDNGPFSPNGALNPTGRYLFVASHPTGIGHVFAFEPVQVQCAPTVPEIGFDNVSETDAELRATINPCNAPTAYTFEYTTEQRFQEEGFANASVAGSGQLAESNSASWVLAGASGLLPDTEYRFRLTASNAVGVEQKEGQFRTYPSYPRTGCPNEAFREGQAAALPDCRAYELVTPPDTNAHAPRGVGSLLGLTGPEFPTREVSPAGDRLSFQVGGGAIPGSEATGSIANDPYLSVRGDGGWTTSYAGPTPREAPSPYPGSTSPDQGYLLWEYAAEGHVRYPDGHSTFVGRGSLGVEPQAVGQLISEGGGHIIFSTGGNKSIPANQLEPDAAPTGTGAVYDRTADEVTHVISLLPGDVPLGADESAEYAGASLDGRGVAFSVKTNSPGTRGLYLRVDDSATFKIGGDEVTFEGIAEGGNQIFYLKEGQLLRFDAATGETTPFTPAGSAAVPVNVSADGSSAYFVSTGDLVDTPNPNGAAPQAGQQNLYLSEEGAISFVGTVTKQDVEGVAPEPRHGLGLWFPAETLGSDPSRTTPDGRVLLFEARANLAGFDTGGHSQVYRYDSPANELSCLSCVPTGGAASGDATLQAEEGGAQQPYSAYHYVANLRADGRRAFFQSPDPLVVGDTDGLQDVYEWEAAGVGSCGRPAGCVQLISSGRSGRIDYLFAVSDSGDDVFFRTSDLLLGSDQGETPSIYDARVGGGFASAAVSGECLGEACQPVARPPQPPAQLLSGAGNVRPGAKAARCPKGKKTSPVRKGKTRCVLRHKPRHRHHKRHERTATNRQGSKR
jgi:hypothetical protein